MEKETKYRISCPSCGQEGILIEKEKIEVPDVIASGDCSDDMSIYFYEFTVESGDFIVIHKDPNQFEHKTICKKCKVEVKEERL
ncbi:hypothetical protein [Thermosulfidibacter takaii]|uniref:hypothetical protein n=1 Tax=Thermosulfidibacter takaii TaxID=412593 RepID=UPI000839392F|nr:hypothetical protein [Thermosulfidibacter takaii]